MKSVRKSSGRNRSIGKLMLGAIPDTLENVAPVLMSTAPKRQRNYGYPRKIQDRVCL